MHFAMDQGKLFFLCKTVSHFSVQNIHYWYYTFGSGRCLWVQRGTEYIIGGACWVDIIEALRKYFQLDQQQQAHVLDVGYNLCHLLLS